MLALFQREPNIADELATQTSFLSPLRMLPRSYSQGMNSSFNHLQQTEKRMASESCEAQSLDHWLRFNSSVVVREEKVQATLANNPVQIHSGATTCHRALG